MVEQGKKTYNPFGKINIYQKFHNNPIEAIYLVNNKNRKQENGRKSGENRNDRKRLKR